MARLEVFMNKTFRGLVCIFIDFTKEKYCKPIIQWTDRLENKLLPLPVDHVAIDFYSENFQDGLIIKSFVFAVSYNGGGY